jgi:predicted nucleotidyltransferase
MSYLAARPGGRRREENYDLDFFATEEVSFIEREGVSVSSLLEKLQQKKNARKQKLMDCLSSMESQLRGMGALKIILFGSLARGDVDVHTDLDILVVMPPSKSGKEWMDFIYERTLRGVASDIIVYNSEEFESALEGSPFLRHVQEEGKVLYEKNT